MAEGRIDDEMIEISDPELEPVAVEPPPKVVIEYRERGVPWMMIPPILVICAVVAVMGYRRLAPMVEPRGPIVATTAIPEPEPKAEVASTTPLQGWPPADKPKPAATAEGNLASPIETAQAPVASTEPVKPVVELPAVAESKLPVVEKPAEAVTIPPGTGIGFDPKAFETPNQGQLPPADPAIAPAARQDPPKEVAMPAEKDLPTEVEVELLPPDPRQARVRVQKRVVEAIQQVEADRTRFHNDLREICRISRDDYLKEVTKLSELYGMQVDPLIKRKAGWLLGETGPFVGADRATRIDVLRKVGFPETAILDDIYWNYEIKKIGERNGASNPSEAMHRSILCLLRYAPGQSASQPRTSARTTPAPPTPGPAVSPRPR